MNVKIKRIFGNWLMTFLSPLMSNTVVFSLPIGWDDNTKILISAILSASIVTGLVIAQVFQNAKSQ